MKKESYAEVTTKDLRDRLEQMELEYLQTKAQHAVSPLDNPAKITRARKEIARVKTELRARELSNK